MYNHGINIIYDSPPLVCTYRCWKNLQTTIISRWTIDLVGLAENPFVVDQPCWESVLAGLAEKRFVVGRPCWVISSAQTPYLSQDKGGLPSGDVVIPLHPKYWAHNLSWIQIERYYLSTYRSRYLVRLRERRSAPRRGHRWYFRKIKEKRVETKHWVCGYHNRQCGYHNWSCGYHNCQCGYHDFHPTEINDHSLFWNTTHNSTSL